MLKPNMWFILLLVVHLDEWMGYRKRKLKNLHKGNKKGILIWIVVGTAMCSFGNVSKSAIIHGD